MKAQHMTESVVLSSAQMKLIDKVLARVSLQSRRKCMERADIPGLERPLHCVPYPDLTTEPDGSHRG